MIISTNITIADAIKVNARLLKFPHPAKKEIPDKIKRTAAIEPDRRIAILIY